MWEFYFGEFGLESLVNDELEYPANRIPEHLEFLRRHKNICFINEYYKKFNYLTYFRSKR